MLAWKTMTLRQRLLAVLAVVYFCSIFIVVEKTSGSLIILHGLTMIGVLSGITAMLLNPGTFRPFGFHPRGWQDMPKICKILLFAGMIAMLGGLVGNSYYLARG